MKRHLQVYTSSEAAGCNTDLQGPRIVRFSDDISLLCCEAGLYELDFKSDNPITICTHICTFSLAIYGAEGPDISEILLRWNPTPRGIVSARTESRLVLKLCSSPTVSRRCSSTVGSSISEGGIALLTNRDIDSQACRLPAKTKAP